MACRNEELGLKAAAELKAQGYDAEYRSLDIANEASIGVFADGMKQSYESIDVLVNNAAIAFKGSDPTPFEQQSYPTIYPNFFGTLNMCNAMLPLLRKSSSPRLVNVASQAGRLGIMKSSELKARFTSDDLTVEELKGLMNQFVADVQSGVHAQRGWPNSNYGMSKLGVIALTRILAREEAPHGVLVNSCCPGYCATDMSSHGGPRSAEHGARTPAMLAADLPDGGPSGCFFYDENVIEW